MMQHVMCVMTRVYLNRIDRCSPKTLVNVTEFVFLKLYNFKKDAKLSFLYNSPHLHLTQEKKRKFEIASSFKFLYQVDLLVLGITLLI